MFFMFKRFFWMLIFLLAGSVAIAAPEPSDGWISLFDGKTLAGWKASENPASFTAKDGKIVGSGPRAHLFFTGTDAAQADFKNFEFETEVKTAPGTNSGVYFHTAWQEKDFPHKGCEVQITTLVAFRKVVTPSSRRPAAFTACATSTSRS
jgi:hypothetical protein